MPLTNLKFKKNSGDDLDDMDDFDEGSYEGDDEIEGMSDDNEE